MASVQIYLLTSKTSTVRTQTLPEANFFCVMRTNSQV